MKKICKIRMCIIVKISLQKSMNKTCKATLLIIIPSSSYERITRYLKNYQNQVLNSNIKIEYLKISEITENYINESVSSRKF